MKISSDFIIGNSEEGIDETLVFLNDCCIRNRVVEDLRLGCHGSEHGVSQFDLDRFCPFPIGRNRRVEIHSKSRCFDVRSNVDNFAQARHTEGDVLAGHTGIMEGIRVVCVAGSPMD